MGRIKKGFQKGNFVVANNDIGNFVTKGKTYEVIDYWGKHVCKDPLRKKEYPLICILSDDTRLTRSLYKYLSASWFTPDYKVREDKIDQILKSKKLK